MKRFLKAPPLYITPLIIFALIAGAFLLSLHRGGMGGGNNKFAQHVGEAAPPTSLPLQDSFARYSGDDWRGHAYVVNFFASWCVGCHAEHEGLMELSSRGIPIIGIAYKDKPDALSKYLSKNGNPYITVARDDDGRAGIDWGITGVPETYIIDKTGIIRFHTAGPLSPDIFQNEFLPVWRDVAGDVPEIDTGIEMGGSK